MIRENAQFRNLLAGRVVTNIGDSLYIIAAMWFVHELFGSALITGVAGFLFRVPRTLQFLAGPIVDRLPLKSVLVASQLVQGVVILVIPLAASVGRLSGWMVLSIIPVLGLINQFVYPAQNAALPRIVEQDNINSANTMFAFAYRGVDLVGNAVGGAVVAIVGAITIFKINSVTFLIAAILFATVTFPPSASEENDQDGDEDQTIAGKVHQYRSDLQNGFDYITDTLLVYIVASAAIANFALGISFAVLPSFSDSFGGPGTYGLMMSAVAGGSLTGAILSNSLDSRSYGLVQILIFVPGSLLWIGAVVVDWAPATIGLFALAWIPVGIFNVMVQSIRQIAVPDDLVGRVTSASVSASAIASPVGSLVGGGLADLIGSSTTLIVAGLGYLSIAVTFAMVRGLRRMPPITRIGPESITRS